MLWALFGETDTNVSGPSASNLAEQEVRRSLRVIVPPMRRILPPPVIESAELTPYTSKLWVTTGRRELSVRSKSITVQFMEYKVVVMGAKEVCLYSGSGLRIRDRSRTVFRFDFEGGIKTQSTPNSQVWFYYGSKDEALLILDQVHKTVKVWAPYIEWETTGAGTIGICELEPRPEIIFPERLDHVQLQLPL